MPAKRCARLLLLLLLVSGCAAPTRPGWDVTPALPMDRRICGERPTDELAVGAWFAAHAVPLKSLTPGAGFDDLKPLQPVLKGVRAVALGEGTHGTHEFMTVRHRLFEYLVKEMDFRIFGVEASYAGALKIDDYLQAGQGDPIVLLKGLNLWPWITTEMLDLIKWMRTYNETAAPDRRLHFVGFDVIGGEEAYIRHAATLNLMSLPLMGQATKDEELAHLRSIGDHLPGTCRRGLMSSTTSGRSAASTSRANRMM